MKNRFCLALLLVWSACHAGAVSRRAQPPTEGPRPGAVQTAADQGRQSQSRQIAAATPERAGKLRF